MPSKEAQPEAVADVMQATKQHYMIQPLDRSLALGALGVRPMSANEFGTAISQMGLDIVRTVKRSERTLQAMSVGTGDAADLVVVRMEPDRAKLIAHTTPMLHVAENPRLEYASALNLMAGVPAWGYGSGAAQYTPKSIRLRVLGSNDAPLAKASVVLVGDTVPAQGVTDDKGEVTLQLITLQDGPARSVFVTTHAGYWDLYLKEPHLSDSSVNLLRLRSYSETIPDFPAQFRHGWGQQLMGLPNLPKDLRGQGVKIAIVDSGADIANPLLSHIKIGRNLTGTGADGAWTDDTIGHGSHCAGIITARSDQGFQGFAPEAEIHVLRVFPGGRYDSLVQAIEYCIENQIDVVNLSLGSDQDSLPIERALQAGVNDGIAFIVAAGNSGGAVQYPARSQYAIAVSALGDERYVWNSGWDKTTIMPEYRTAQGLFSPSFTCYGPQVGLTAPGVAIISTVPGGYEAMSGTSMAAPHVTGMAALLLAHHPLFRTQFQARSLARTTALFSLLRGSCMGLPFGADRVGFGMPNLTPFFGAPQGAQAGSQAQPAPQAVSPMAWQVAPLAWPR